ncbi:hypothetical protein PROFUN_06708 [Planoprotostelium fungivorum]|uniref:SH2 domain-containing protein n=1 Tax=Planoprotostelium fungivorum TaxID=1890364 RepID=A0A2P6NG67_9EUKA|nr:hypothetical protein PROFUN_06708 [Planoprotostelium fungivorum]
MCSTERSVIHRISSLVFPQIASLKFTLGNSKTIEPYANKKFLREERQTLTRSNERIRRLSATGAEASAFFCVEWKSLAQPKETWIDDRRWLFSDVKTVDAAIFLLRGRKRGTYMIRASGSVSSAFTVSVVAGLFEFYHFRVLFRENGGDKPFVINVKGEERCFSSLEQMVSQRWSCEVLVNNRRKKIKLSTPLLRETIEKEQERRNGRTTV